MSTTNLTARLSGRKPSQRNTPVPVWLQRAQAHGLPAKELVR